MNTAKQNIKKPKVDHEKYCSFETVFAFFIKLHIFALLIYRPQDERDCNKYEKQYKKKANWNKADKFHFGWIGKHRENIWKQKVRKMLWAAFQKKNDNKTVKPKVFQDTRVAELAKEVTNELAYEKDQKHYRNVRQKVFVINQ